MVQHSRSLEALTGNDDVSSKGEIYALCYAWTYTSSCTSIRASGTWYTRILKECAATLKLFILEPGFPVPVIDFTIEPDDDMCASFDVEWAGALSSFP